jgi:hypothetical protein
MTLMPVSNLSVDRTLLVDRFSEDIEDAAEGLLADGDGDWGAGGDRLHAADEAVCGLQSDAADAAFAGMLGDLDGDVDRLGDIKTLAGDADRGMDDRNLFGGELDVDGGPATWITFPSTSVAVALDMMFPYSRAAAPLTTSMISLVILAWRTRFMYSVSLSITSLALDVAASMAVMRAACSAAADSRKA